MRDTVCSRGRRFVIPVLETLVRRAVSLEDMRRDGPACLVLTPTRELAIQVEEEFRKVACHMGMRTVCVYGGVPYSRQVPYRVCALVFRVSWQLAFGTWQLAWWRDCSCTTALD